jgi:hypothetical protein
VTETFGVVNATSDALPLTARRPRAGASPGVVSIGLLFDEWSSFEPCPALTGELPAAFEYLRQAIARRAEPVTTAILHIRKYSS